MHYVHLQGQKNTQVQVADKTLPRAAFCITVKVMQMQTKADAQCDKFATELSWQRLRRLTFSSYLFI